MFLVQGLERFWIAGGNFHAHPPSRENSGKVKIMLYIKQLFYIQSSCFFHNHLHDHSIHEQHFINFIIFIHFFFHPVWGNLMTSCISFLHIDSRCISKPQMCCKQKLPKAELPAIRNFNFTLCINLHPCASCCYISEYGSKTICYKNH